MHTKYTIALMLPILLASCGAPQSSEVIAPTDTITVETPTVTDTVQETVAPNDEAVAENTDVDTPPPDNTNYPLTDSTL